MAPIVQWPATMLEILFFTDKSGESDFQAYIDIIHEVHH